MGEQIVVDASVGVKWRLDDEVHTQEARALLKDYADGRVDLIAPKLFMVEVANAFAVAVMRQRIEEVDARESFQAVIEVGFSFLEDSDYLIPAWEIAAKHSLSIYDALYLALAESIGCDFYTGDDRLYKAVEEKLPYVKWIGNYK
jgi:predicted nucleic acid-binding protein